MFYTNKTLELLDFLGLVLINSVIAVTFTYCTYFLVYLEQITDKCLNTTHFDFINTPKTTETCNTKLD